MFFFQPEDGIRDSPVTGVQTCALPIFDFDTLRAAELWDHSTLDLVDVAHSSAEKVHFRVVASRRYADGSPYRTNPGLYIVTQQDGHWGLQLQSVQIGRASCRERV